MSSNIELNKSSLERSRRAILRNLSTDKGSVSSLLEQNPSIELAHRIAATIEIWTESLKKLEEIDLGLIECAEEEKTSDELTKYEIELTKDFSKYKSDLALAKGKLAAMFEKLNATKSVSPGRRSMVPTASFIEAYQTNPLLKIQEMPVPKFDGKRQNFTDWHNEFTSTVHENTNLTDFQKMYLLKRALVGEAETLLKDYTLSAEMYSSAYEFIKQRFDNKRVIIATHFAEIIDLPDMKMATLRSSFDRIQRAVRGLKVCGLDTNKLSPLITFVVARKLPERLRIDWENTNHDYSAYPSFDSLASFVSNRCFAYETSHAVSTEQSSQKSSSTSTSKTTSTSSTSADRKSKASFATFSKKSSSSANAKCACCEQAHYLTNCSKFTSMSTTERQGFVKEKQLCENCLRRGHEKSTCRHTKCRVCQGLHHTMLHDAIVTLPSAPSTAENKSTFSLITRSSNAVLLPTAIVNVRVGSRVIAARALIDSCSQINIVSESFVRKCKIKLEKSVTVVVGMSPEGVHSSGSVSLNLESRIRNYKITVIAEVVGCIPYEVGPEIVRTIAATNAQLELADRDHSSSTVDLLIGGEFANEILLKEKLFVDGLCFQESQFGWIAAGPIRTHRKVDLVSCNLTVAIQDALCKFWEIEEVEPPKITSSEHELCEAHFLSTYSRLPDGRFKVRLPFKKNPNELANTFSQARRALLNVETKLDKETRTMYIAFMNEYKQLGHMVPAKVAPEIRPYFIPHLPVIRPDSSTTVLRTVFNASAKNSSGISLNQALLVGPVLQPDLFDILVQFRIYQVAFSADISKMYRQIMVHEKDCHFQTILWRDDPSEEIKAYELTTLTYGTSPASYIATKSLQIIGQEIEAEHPEAASAITSAFYMDDLLTGANSASQAIEKQRCIHQTLMKAKFPLRKYVSNSQEFINSLDPTLVETLKPVSFSASGSAKVLGIEWHPHEDDFRIRTKLVEIENITLSKRTVSSLISSVFDPLGLATPVTILGKILLQDLWREGKDWDDPISHDLAVKFREFYREISELPPFRIPRAYPQNFHLVAYCDASPRAYGAAIYAQSGDSRVLVCSKSKVAPIKTLSILRLELLGATILIKLLKRVSKTLHLDINTAKAYSDSTVVLAWLKGPPARFETFVRNRVEFITSTLPFERWGYVNTTSNPADLLTRRISAKMLTENYLWLHGPKLSEKGQEIEVSLPTDPPEVRKKAPTVFFTSTQVDESLICRFSNFDDLLRIIIRVLTFVSRVRTRDQEVDSNRNNALNAIYRVSQTAWFATEIDILKKPAALKSSCPLASLDPFIDQFGVLRVGGRLKNSSLPYDTKHPIIIHAKSTLAKLLARHIHEKYFHASQSFVVGFLRHRFWLVHGSTKLVKFTIKSCVYCTRMKAEIVSQIMGDLPPDRVNVSRPFAASGVDFAGPFTIKCTNHRTYKYIKHYAAFFVCFSTRAVHIESVADLTTEAFISALQRFVARRGVPHTIWSDNATNFVGARNLVDRYCTTNGIMWKFIPPRSPHHGGLWEAAVKAGKKHFFAAAKGVILTEDEFKTTLAMVEAILNSRPLYARRTKSQEIIDVLTPGHFLTGSHLLEPPEPEKDITSLFEKFDKHRRHITAFWNAWKKSYLGLLQTRQKWKKAQPNLEVGDIVLLKEDTSPPSVWPMGIITDVKPDKHGRLRIITVRSKNAEFLRSAQKVVKLPIENCKTSLVSPGENVRRTS